MAGTPSDDHAELIGYMQCAASSGGRCSDLAALAHDALLRAAEPGASREAAQAAHDGVVRYMISRGKFSEAWRPLLELDAVERASERCCYCALPVSVLSFRDGRGAVVRHLRICPRCGFIQDSKGADARAVEHSACCFTMALDVPLSACSAYGGAISTGYAPDTAYLERCASHASETRLALRLPARAAAGPVYLSIGVVSAFDVTLIERRVRAGTLPLRA